MKHKFKITVKLWNGYAFDCESERLPIVDNGFVSFNGVEYALIGLKEFTVKVLPVVDKSTITNTYLATVQPNECEQDY